MTSMSGWFRPPTMGVCFEVLRGGVLRQAVGDRQVQVTVIRITMARLRTTLCVQHNDVAGARIKVVEVDPGAVSAA